MATKHDEIAMHHLPASDSLAFAIVNLANPNHDRKLDFVAAIAASV